MARVEGLDPKETSFLMHLFSVESAKYWARI
jgi:hypothetical protein